MSPLRSIEIFRAIAVARASRPSVSVLTSSHPETHGGDAWTRRPCHYAFGCGFAALGSSVQQMGSTCGNYYTGPFAPAASLTRSRITSAMCGSLPMAEVYHTSLPFLTVGLRQVGSPFLR